MDPTKSQPERLLYTAELQGEKAVIHVKSYQITDNEIQAAVSKIFGNLGKGIHKLTIKKEGETVVVKKSGKIITDSGTSSLTINKIAAANLQGLNADTIPEKIKRGALRIFLSPFLALKRLLTGRAKAAKAFVEETQCKNFSGFSSLLKTTEAVAGKKNMAGATEFGERIQKAFTGKKESLDDIATDIAKRVTDLPDKNKLAVPCGYYDEQNEFHPLLAVFSNEGGNLTMELLGSDPKEPQQVKFDVKSDNLKDSIEKLLSSAKPPSKSSVQSEEQKKETAFEALLNSFNNSAFTKTGETRLSLAELQKGNIVGTLLQKTDIDASDAKKAVFMLELVHTHMARHIGKIGSFSEKDQIAILESLLAEYDQAETVCKQELGFTKGLESDSQFKNLTDSVRKIRSRLLHLQQHQTGKSEGRKDKDFETASTVSRSKVLMPKTALDVKGVKPSEEISQTTFSELKIACTTQSTEGALASLSAISKKLNTMVDAQQYDLVIKQATDALSCLPPPNQIGSSAANLWSSISEVKTASAYQTEITTILKCLWEAKLQRGDASSSPEEVINIAVAQAVISRLAETKGAAAGEAILAKLTGATIGTLKLPEDGGLKNELRKLAIENRPKFIALYQKIDREYYAPGAITEKTVDNLSKAIIAHANKADFLTELGIPKDEHYLKNQALHAMALQRPCTFGALCKQLEIPKELMNDYIISRKHTHNEAFISLLIADKFILSYDKESQERALQLKDFYNKKPFEQIKMYDKFSTFQYTIASANKLYDKALKEPLSDEQSLKDKYYNGYTQEKEIEYTFKLSEQYRQLRSIEVMNYCLMHPDSVLYPPHFSKDKDIKWAQELQAKAADKGGTEEETKAYAIALYKGQIQQQLKAMGRLTVDVHTDSQTTTTILKGASNGKELRLSTEAIFTGSTTEKKVIFDPYNPSNTAEYIGDIDQAIATSFVGNIHTSDTELDDPRQCAPTRSPKGYSDMDVLAYREDSFAEAAKETGDPKTFYQLSTMRLLEERTAEDDYKIVTEENAANTRIDVEDDYGFHCLSCVNALEFIINSPEKLSTPSTKRFVESTLFRPPLLLEAIKESPIAFNERIPKLKATLSKAIANEEKELALYLRHVISTIEEFITPGSSTAYKDLRDNTKIVEELSKGIDAKPISQETRMLALYYMDALKLSSTPLTQKENELVIKCYQMLKATPLGFDLVSLHRQALSWAEKAIPGISKTTTSLSTSGDQSTPILDVIKKHPDYTQIFGGRDIAGKLDDSTKKAHYYVTVEGKKFQLEYLKDNKELIIKQQINVNGSDNWYQLCHIESTSTQHTDATISHYNAWVDNATKTAIVICDDPIQWNEDNLLIGKISFTGNLEALTTLQGKPIVFDPKGTKTKWLSCFDSSRILMHKGSQGAVDTLRILGTSITLEKTGTVWSHEGYEWTAAEDRSKLNSGTQNILRALGSAADDITMSFHGKSGDKIILMPYAISPQKKLDGTGKSILHFEKEDIASPLTKPIVIKIENEKVVTTASGFLYLATIAAHQKNFKEAFFYLSEAKRLPIGKNEIAQFNKIAESLALLPETSMRACAFKLKAELMTTSMIRVQHRDSTLHPPGSPQHLAWSRKISVLHEQYKKAIEERAGSLNQLLFKELALSENEVTELDDIYKKSMLYLTTESKENAEIAKPADRATGRVVTKDTIESAEKAGHITEQEKVELLKKLDDSGVMEEEELFKKFKEEKIDLIAKKHELEIQAKIDKRLREISTPLEVLEAAPLNPVAYPDAKLDKDIVSEFFTRSTSTPSPTIASVDTTPAEKPEGPLSTMKVAEKSLQEAGISAAKIAFNTEQTERVVLKPDSIQTLTDQIKARTHSLKGKDTELKKAIKESIIAHKRDNPAIRSILRHASLLGDDMVRDRVLDLYQKRAGTGDAALDNLLTKFLLLGTELKHLEKASTILTSFNSITDPESKTVASSEIKRLILSGTGLDRYESLDPAIAKKYLVTEYRRGIVLRQGQREAIDAIRKDPNSLMQLRMGLGKTSYILPIVMQILAEEKGLLPIAIVPQELYAMNRTDMDVTTREIFQQAAHELNLSQETLSSSLLLLQELDKILEVQQNQGYIITTIEQIASLEHAITLCDENIHANGLTTEVENQRKLLCQLKQTLTSDKTQFFADEADEVFSVNKEINISIPGKERSVDAEIRNAGLAIFTHILSTDHSTDPALAILQKAIISRTQASLSKAQINGALTSLKTLGPEKLGLTDDNAKNAFKKMLEGPLLDVLQRNPEVDFGIQSKTGYTTGPRSEKKEQTGMKFGDEYELVLYNMIQYINTGPSDAFVTDQLRGMRLTDPERYTSLKVKAGAGDITDPQAALESIINYIKQPLQWAERLEILEKNVFSKGLVTLSAEQLTLNVQDIIRDKQCGGISGTMSPASLPEGFKAGQEEGKARIVEGETYVKLGSAYPTEGLKKEVEVVKDTAILDNLKEMIKDTDIKAIINMGLSIEGKNAKEIAKDLCTSSKRPIVFVDPDERRPYIWQQGSENPTPLIDGMIPDGAVVFYDPADKRGTDFKIPAGKALYLPGPTTTEEQFCQGVWRMRQLGFSQSADALIPESIAIRIRTQKGLAATAPITLGDVIADIQSKTLELQAQKNVKAEFLKIRGIAVTGLRTVLHDPTIDPKVAKAIYQACREPYFVQKKDVDFAFTEPKDIDVFTMLSESCENHKANFEKIIAQLKKLDSPPSPIIAKIEDIQNALMTKQKEFTETTSKDAHAKHLPTTIKSSFSETSGSVAQQQVQTQQQQQVQTEQQQQQVTQVTNTKAPPMKKTPKPLKSILSKTSFSANLSVHMSDSATQLMKSGTIPGSGAFRLARAQNAEGKISLTIISKQDAVSLHDEAKSTPSPYKLEIFSFDEKVSPKDVHPPITMLDSFKTTLTDDKKSPEKQPTPNDVTICTAIIRFYLGYQPVTYKEKIALKDISKSIFIGKAASFSQEASWLDAATAFFTAATKRS